VSSEEYICEDYKIILPHQIEVEFYNPEDKKIKLKISKEQ
jgi:hypothetical protein